MSASLAVKLGVIAFFAIPATYIHFRGRVRHRFLRQLTDHSTFLAPYNLLVTAFSSVPRKPMLDVEDFPELKPLTDHWQIIREEAEALITGGHVRPAEKHNDVAFNTFFRRGWTRFYIKWYDQPLASARELCPRTVDLVQSIPTVNAALFAMMKPQSMLGEHRDPFAGSVRYHLGLITPNSDQCRIYVDGNPYAWRDGQAVMFDETYIHSVRNDTDESRIILFCDVARPIPNRAMRAINRFVTNHIVKITAAQNTEAEQVGIVNGVSGWIYKAKTFFERVKRANRTLYYAGKYVLIAAIIYAVFLRNFF